MLCLKDNAIQIGGLTQEMMFALGVVTEIFGDYSHDCVVTAGLDGKHNPGSLHPCGKAVDIRTKTFDAGELQLAIARIRQRLEPMGFDVVAEKEGSTAATTGEHLHVEFDPKGRVFWQLAR